MKMNLKVVFMLCLTAVLAFSSAWAASPHKQLVAEVPHDFVVGDTMMPAGKYLLEREGSNPPMITVRNSKGEGSAILHVITTLARTGMDEREAKLVFDKTSGRTELSEVWFAGQDGFLVCGTVAPHTHELVDAKN